MTTAEPASTNRRVFRYADHTFDDPGADYSVEQVRQALLPYFPELAQATAEERPLADGTLQITFRKQVTTKGAAGGEPIAPLVEALASLPPYADPLEILWWQLAGSRLTLRALYEQRELLASHAGQRDEASRARQEVIRRCLAIRPIPLPDLPLGF
jgi:PRTRC genetic system protein C